MTQVIPVYEKTKEFYEVLSALQEMPPIVATSEINNLKQQLAECESGKRNLLHIGDCAELFSDCRSKVIRNKMLLFDVASGVLSTGTNLPTTTLGRIAGQYTKPRSSPIEVINNATLPSYKGDLVNQHPACKIKRQPDPKRMLEGLKFSAATMNAIRIAIADTTEKNAILDRKMIMQQLGKSFSNHKLNHLISRTLNPAHSNLDFLFVSHEALNLDYEKALTSTIENNYLLSLGAHLVWCGARSNHPSSPVVSFMSTINNPIGVKISSETNANELLKVLDILDPNQERGKLLLITRFGVEKVEKYLPPILKAILSTGRKSTWVCDPMHGNTVMRNNYKTRYLSDIKREVFLTKYIHQHLGNRLAGLHLEATGCPITECIGGVDNVTEKNLHHLYKSPVDPRLSFNQTVEVLSEYCALSFITTLADKHIKKDVVMS